MTAALALWFAQEWLCFGSAADAWQNMTRAVTDRVSLTDGAVRDVNVPQVLAQYFRESTEPLLQLGPVSVAAWQLLLFALLLGAVSVVACLRRGTAALKKAWQSWQKFGERTRFGDCKAVSIR